MMQPDVLGGCLVAAGVISSQRGGATVEILELPFNTLQYEVQIIYIYILYMFQKLNSSCHFPFSMN